MIVYGGDEDIMDKIQALKTCDLHITELSKRLEEFYSYTIPVEYEDGNGEKTINVLRELEKLDFLEKVYSVVEKEGVAEGVTYDKYMEYLSNIRKEREILNDKKVETEIQNAAEIKNINLLIRSFKNKTEELK